MIKDHLYPVYLVHEHEFNVSKESSQPFKVADPMFRGKSLRLEPTNHHIGFQAWTNHDVFVVEMNYEILDHKQGVGEVMLFFDLHLSHRKNHNMIVFRIDQEQNLIYQEYRYELETLDIPEGVSFSARVVEHEIRVRLTLPLSLLQIRTCDQKTIGFNAVRALDPSKDAYVTWSGIKGDKSQLGQGTGILLLTRGLQPDQFNQLAGKIGTEEDTYFTKWIKRKVPEEIYGLIQAKKKGLTVRMNEEDVYKAKENADKTGWGREMKREIIQIADYWSAYSDDELFDLVPTGNPRAFNPSVHFGDPIEGGKRPFHLCLERPYQYYNSKTNTWWFNGMKIRNPSTGEEVVVEDNGEGFLTPDGFPNPGVRYMFTATYRLFILSMLMGEPRCPVLEDTEICPETTGKRYAGAIPNMAYAYQLTGDKKYAFKALILIGRIAELVPYMNGNYNQYDTVQIAEPTTSESHWLSNFFDALDLLYDSADELSPELDVLFARKPDAANKTRTAPFCLKQAVLEMIPSVLYSCEIEKTRSADWSLRWIYLELIIASFMQSGKLMHHILYEGKHSLQSKMRNCFFRDGRYTYDSYHYINHICEQMAMMPNNNYCFKDDVFFPNGIDMFEDPQFSLRPVLELYCKLKCGSLTPMLGDFQAINNEEPIPKERRQGKFEYHPSFEIIFRRMNSLRPLIGSVMAQYEPEELTAHRVRYVNYRPQKHALLLLATAAEREEYLQYRNHDSVIQPSYLMQDSETSVFRSGTNHHNCKHVILYGQPTAGHAHGDKLGLWIAAYGYNLLTGIGGYPTSWVSPKWHAWDEHSAACAAVIVDGKNQEASYSKLKCHYEGRLLQVSGMENTTAFPGTHDERWICVIQAPNCEDAYVVDLNYLSGGGTFDYNTIGLDSSFEQIRFQGISEREWVPMKGTLAGENILLYSEPGYGWMKAVKKAEAVQPISWTYKYAGAALKIHTVPDDEPREIVCSLGERGGQEPGKSRWEPFVMWRDASEDKLNHTASFFSILEPFEQFPFIYSVQRMQLIECKISTLFKPLGIELIYRDDQWKDILICNYGEGDYVRYQDSQGTEYVSDAQVLFLRFKGFQLHAIEAIGYSNIQINGRAQAKGFGLSYHTSRKQAYYRGIVTAVDIDSRMIEVELDWHDEKFAAQLEGVAALINSPDYVKPSVYLLKKPQIEGRKLTFYSDMSLIKLDEDWSFPHKRRGLGNKQVVEYNGKNVYVDVKPGDRFMLWNSIQQSFPDTD